MSHYDSFMDPIRIQGIGSLNLDIHDSTLYTPRNAFDSIPRDCKFIIFSFLDFNTIKSTSIVCKEWKDITNSVTLYKLLCNRLWNVNVPDEKATDWKRAYIDIVTKDVPIVESADDWPAVEKAASNSVPISMLRADFLYSKGIEKFTVTSSKCSPLLGNYANFHWNFTKNYDMAEKYYHLAIQADKSNVWPLCNYATFLWDVRHKFDDSEVYYKKAIEADPTHLDTLLNFADFLHEVKNDNDRAEQTYINAMDQFPDSVKLLGHYGLFLLNKRKKIEKAREMYKKAAEMHVDNAEALGNYAWFLSSDHSKDYAEAEKYYKKAIEINPNYVHVLYNYAMFLQDDRRDYAQAKQYYQQALHSNPASTRILQSYSALLAQMKDFENADKTFHLALHKEPDNIDLLRSYAHYLSAYKKDHEQAEIYNLKALRLSPEDPYVLVNYASCLLLQKGKEQLGYQTLQRALHHPSVIDMPFILTVACLVNYIHSPTENTRIQSLSVLKYYLFVENVRLPNGSSCNLECNIEKGVEQGHPDMHWIPKLISVFMNEIDISVLNDWNMWVIVDPVKLVSNSGNYGNRNSWS